MTPPATTGRTIDVEEPTSHAWLARFFGRCLAGYVWLVARTARFSGGPINQDTVIYAIWHETNLVGAIAAYRLVKNRRAVSFSTRGFRGIVMNTMLRSFGAKVVTLPDEGRSTRTEAAAMAREMAALGRSGHLLVVSCDGPFGPYRVAKPGVLIVARESGLPIQPWAVASRPPLRLNNRWDRMIVALPFGRMRVFEGPPLVLGQRDRIKPFLTELQARLDVVQARA
ncbi:MAG TPA: hypothetical protein VF114_02160, partial [Candidatus Limnocylindria bacterium]